VFIGFAKAAEPFGVSMSEQFVFGLSEVYRVLFICTAALVPLYPPSAYWKIYSVYKSVGDDAKRLGFFWFSFQFQVPRFASGFLEPLDPDRLPDSSRQYLNRTQHQLRLIRTMAISWVLLVLAFGAITALIRRHYT
jgi:hypothetical protein